MIYIQLDKALYGNQPEDFICKVAKTPDEVKALVENGFEDVCDLDNLKFFRKRK